MRIFWFFSMLISLSIVGSRPINGPEQPSDGPGGRFYPHDSVRMYDYASEADGYWLFEPASPRPDSAPVVVFNHGYGSYNPMIYGQWIRHLARRGNTVIFPRYQRNLISPLPETFAHNAASAIANALARLQSDSAHVNPTQAPLCMVGHSYGGVISAFLGVKYESLDIPRPAGIMLVAPGTGPLTGGRLESYEDLPIDTRLLIVQGSEDIIVGYEFGNLVFETAIHTPKRNLLRYYPDDHGEPDLEASHNEAYCVDLAFDSGLRNLSALRALQISQTNAIDHHGFWKLFDALIDCTRNIEHCSCAFGDTEEQRSLGQWSDGQPVRKMEVFLPGEMGWKGE